MGRCRQTLVPSKYHVLGQLHVWSLQNFNGNLIYSAVDDMGVSIRRDVVDEQLQFVWCRHDGFN